MEFILLLLATLRVGAICLPLNVAYPPDEIEYFLSDSQARLFFAHIASKGSLEGVVSGLPELAKTIYLDPASPNDFLSRIGNFPMPAPLPSPPDDATAVIIYTSGTTGRPKGVEITHGNLTSNLEALRTAWGWRAEDVLLHVLPIFHVHGLFVALHGALHAGARTILMREFDAHKTLQTLVDRQCTVFMAVPTIHTRLIHLPDASQFDLSHMRLITSGSDRLPDEVFTGFQRTFGYTLLERYGMTETGMNASNPLDRERRMGSVGLTPPRGCIRGVAPGNG